MEFLIENKEWLFGGVGVEVIKTLVTIFVTFIVSKILYKKETKKRNKKNNSTIILKLTPEQKKKYQFKNTGSYKNHMTNGSTHANIKIRASINTFLNRSIILIPLAILVYFLLGILFK